MPPRSVRRDLLALSALCAVIYFLGLTAHGLTNWQEAQRALVARDMQARGEWIVPTVHGRPYLAKPPMIYWCQRALAGAMGRRTGELELRLTVALAGWLGVLATYLAARRLLRSAAATDPDGSAADGAWWAALFLATGTLYVRSARIGELDILLVPFTVVAIAALHAAWMRHLEQRRTHWGAVALAALAAAGAALTKGPPGVLAIALGAYGGIALHAARGAVPAARVVFALGGLLAAGAAVLLGEFHRPIRPDEVLGLALIAGAGGWIATVLRRLCAPARARGLLAGLHRTHPVGVMGVSLLALWWWGRAVAGRIGDQTVMAAADAEAADNLRVLVLESPLNNLEAAAYGVGLGSAAAIASVVWMIRRRPSLGPGMWTVGAWALLGLVAFGVLGKGVARYLTPLWPAIAIVGGVWAAHAIRSVRRPWLLARLLGSAVLVLALAQAWWYGDGRERFFGERSPRAFLAELLRPELGVDRHALASLDLWEPSLDYYADAHVRPVECDGTAFDFTGPRLSLAEFGESLRTAGARATVLIRASPAPGREGPAPLQRLVEAGFIVQTLPVSARYVIDRRRTDVIAVRILVPAHGGD